MLPFLLWGLSSLSSRLTCRRLQDVAVANPPTLLMVVDSLLVSAMEGDMGGDGEPSMRLAPTCEAEGASEAGGSRDGEGLDTVLDFLGKSQPLLDEWMRWLLVTQRPGAKGWGQQGSRSPIGAFQV